MYEICSQMWNMTLQSQKHRLCHVCPGSLCLTSYRKSSLCKAITSTDKSAFKFVCNIFLFKSRYRHCLDHSHCGLLIVFKLFLEIEMTMVHQSF